MNKYIITTTINPPTPATLKFAEIAKLRDWTFVVIGDTKTPHESYYELSQNNEHVLYLDPSSQEKLYLELSNIIGWKTIQRRNIGFKYAYDMGADVVATVDDDNIPYADWGTDLYIGKEVEVDYWEPENDVFDPLAVTNYDNLWHRGYPIEYLQTKNRVNYLGKKKVVPLVQADLWDGDPDIDAMCRLTLKPVCKFDVKAPYASNKISPFNSQNTFLHRDVLKCYAVWPFVGRMDDIWGGYYAQSKIGTDRVIYNRASVYQDRNVQDLVTNLENETIGYRNTKNFLVDFNLKSPYIKDETREFIDKYFKSFK